MSPRGVGGRLCGGAGVEAGSCLGPARGVLQRHFGQQLRMLIAIVQRGDVVIRLAPGGALLLELGAGQADAVNTLLAARKFRDISVRSDYQNIPRFAAGFHG